MFWHLCLILMLISCKNIAVTTETKVAEGRSQKGTNCVDFKYLCKYLELSEWFKVFIGDSN